MPARDPWFIMDGATALVDAEEARLGAAAIFTPGDTGVLARSGVMPAAGTPLRVHQTPTASGSLLVDAGQAVVQGTTSATQGAYTATLDAQLTLAYLATYPADAQPRKDIIVARINDKAYAGSTAEFKIDIIKGTASGSPVDPTLPASCVALARINLPASAATVADAVIDDLRTWTVPRGGILPTGAGALPTAPYTGQPIFDSTGRLRIWNGSAWATPVPNIPAASSTVTASSSATSGTTALTLATCSTTCDGVNAIEIRFSCIGITFTVATDKFDLALFVDGTQVGATRLIADYAGIVNAVSSVYALSTPAAGSRTITAKITRTSGTGTATVSAAGTTPMFLTVKQFV